MNELPALNEHLFNAGNYYAHLSKTDRTCKETLEEHISLVNNYLKKIVAVHQLDNVIDNLIKGLKKDIDTETGNCVKVLFVHTIVFHDYGKINERFQVDKMNNSYFRDTLSSSKYIGSNHSVLSAYIYLTTHLNDIAIIRKSNPLLIVCCLYFAYSIFKHHGHFFDDDAEQTITFSQLKARNNWNEVKLFLNQYLDKYQFEINPNIFNIIGSEQLFSYSQFTLLLNSFELYALCRLNFSLLTASDYLATNEYINSLSIKDFGVLSQNRISELHANISQKEFFSDGKRNYNKTAYDAIEEYELQNPQEKSGNNLNILRKEMAIEVIRNIRLHFKNNLFFIEAPTGGGKTNLSILTTLELLNIYEGTYNKVFYVFPFTTLITQTRGAVCSILGLSEEEIIELHSKGGLKTNEEDDKYGDQKLNYINYLFVNYPFTLLSHIKFFEILKTNEKNTNYLLHRLANSIVVIDELQSYNPSHWDKIIYLIRQYSEKFNIKFILMSATLPKLDKLRVIKQRGDDFVNLLPDAKKLYFNNPNFAGRVNFNFELLENERISLGELANRIIEESKAYSVYDFGKAKPKNSVYTIVEFIYKQAATDFYKEIQRFGFFDEILVLSGTILEHRRKEIINYLKNPNNRERKVLLITTQVVEAGVDIDMDLGFKDRSIIDSDEQLAGRINRNVNKEHCSLFLFNYNKESVCYGKDYRYKITKEQIKFEEYKRILFQKDFDALYDKIFEERNSWNSQEMVENFSNYELLIHKLRFRSVNENLKLIEQKNLSCFIPLNIPVEIDGIKSGTYDLVFTPSELMFLAANGVYPNSRKEISGVQVFDLYLRSVTNKIEFTEQQIRKKILSSILSKYTFSIFASSKTENELVHFYDKEKSEYGYFYISRWAEIYSIKNGLDANKLVGIEDTQFM